MTKREKQKIKRQIRRVTRRINTLKMLLVETDFSLIFYHYNPAAKARDEGRLAKSRAELSELREKLGKEVDQ